MAMQTEESFSSYDIISRLRTLESRQDDLREKLLVINQNMIESYKTLVLETKTLSTELKDIKKTVQELQDALKKIVSELDEFAKKDNIKILEKYINFFNPMNFVTQDELSSLLKKRGNKNRKRKKRK